MRSRSSFVQQLGEPAQCRRQDVVDRPEQAVGQNMGVLVRPVEHSQGLAAQARYVGVRVLKRPVRRSHRLGVWQLRADPLERRTALALAFVVPAQQVVVASLLPAAQQHFAPRDALFGEQQSQPRQLVRVGPTGALQCVDVLAGASLDPAPGGHHRDQQDDRTQRSNPAAISEAPSGRSDQRLSGSWPLSGHRIRRLDAVHRALGGGRANRGSPSTWSPEISWRAGALPSHWTHACAAGVGARPAARAAMAT